MSKMSELAAARDQIDRLADAPAPMCNAAFTAGPCVATGELSVIGDNTHWCGGVVQDLPAGRYRGRIAGIQSCNHIGGIGQDEAKANANLIAEAFTVAHETGLTPRQLAERCKELEAALEPFSKACARAAWPTFESDNTLIDTSFDIAVGQLRAARAAIAKTGGAA
jgi:hypothetical protein